MHLAIVSPFPPSITGIGQYGYHVSRILAQTGLFTRITVLTGESGTAKPLEVPAPIQINYAWRPDKLDAGWRVASELGRIRPDLAWFNLGASIFGRSPLVNLGGFLSPFESQRLGIPTILTLHELTELVNLRALKSPGGRFAPLGARLLTRMALHADVICLTIKRYEEWLSKHYPQKKFLHIPIGAYYTPEMLPESQTCDLLLFTTLAPFKGLELIILAYQSLQSIYPDLRLTIAGAEHARFPGYAGQLRQTFSAVSGIRWLGQVPENQVRQLFQQALIVVLPYTASTGSSSVLFQAAMWGRAIVASDLPEIQAVGQEGNLNIAFFQNGQVEDLSRVLKTLLESPNQRQEQVDHNFRIILRYRPLETCLAYLRAFNMALAVRNSPKRIVIPEHVHLESG